MHGNSIRSTSTVVAAAVAATAADIAPVVVLQRGKRVAAENTDTSMKKPKFSPDPSSLENPVGWFSDAMCSE